MRRTLVAAANFALFFAAACAPEVESREPNSVVGDFPVDLSTDSQASAEAGPEGRGEKARSVRNAKKKPRKPRRGAIKMPKPEAPSPEAPSPEAPSPDESCLFGDSYRTLRDSAAFTLADAREIIDETRTAELSESQAIQLVRRGAGGHEEEPTDLTSAIAAVDQGEINRLVLAEIEGTRSFVVYEYGAGDNSYGGAFEGEGTELGRDSGRRLAGLQHLDQAHAGSACGGGWGDNCDSGLICTDFDGDEGAGVCAAGP